jgi:adenosylcobinamide-phosphate synthase
VSALSSGLLALAVALILDRAIGDPRWLWEKLPHPVALAGRVVAWLDARLNDPTQSFSQRRRSGALAMVLLIAGAAMLGAAVHRLVSLIPFGVAIEVALVAILLAQKSLLEHVAAVARALAMDGIPGGRRAVARIVGRDVSVLDESGVARAAVESAAENFSDGVVAPAFWYALLGLPGLFLYKVANTADSMIGNRSERHEAFGWAAARVDDLLNLIPARLSAMLIVGAACATSREGRRALLALRDAPLHKSPNAGWPEAALAGALDMALGGPRRYGYIAVDGAWLNAEGRSDPDAADVLAALRQIDAAWAILVALVAGAAIAPWLAR